MGRIYTRGLVGTGAELLARALQGPHGRDRLPDLRPRLRRRAHRVGPADPQGKRREHLPLAQRTGPRPCVVTRAVRHVAEPTEMTSFQAAAAAAAWPAGLVTSVAAYREANPAIQSRTARQCRDSRPAVWPARYTSSQNHSMAQLRLLPSWRRTDGPAAGPWVCCAPASTKRRRCSATLSADVTISSH